MSDWTDFFQNNQNGTSLNYQLTIFDKFVYSSNKRPLKDVIMELSSNLKNQTKNIYNLLYKHEKSIKFKIDNNTFVDLYSTRTFKAGSTISHLDNSFKYSSDELMIHCSNPIKKNEKSYLKIYGPKTIRILESIGWSTRKRIQNINNKVLNVNFSMFLYDETTKKEDYEKAKLQKLKNRWKCIIV